MKKLLYFSLLLFFSCKPSFEKDGGIRIVLEARDADKTQIEEIKMILAKRLDAFGVSNPIVRAGDKSELIIVEIPDKAANPERLRGLLQSSAKLEFWETHDNATVYEKLMKVNDALSKELYPELLSDTVEEKKALIPKEEEVLKLEGTMEEQFAAQKSEEEKQEEARQESMKKYPLLTLLQPAINYDMRGMPTGLTEGPRVGVALLTDTAKINALLNSPTAKEIFGRDLKFLWTQRSNIVNDPMKPKSVLELIAIKIPRTDKAAMWGNIIDHASANTEYGSPQISITMNQIAGFDWQKLTKNNVGKHIAVVLDDIVYSYPVVAGEIAGGKASITGRFTMQEAEDLASVMKAGYLPVRVRIVSEETVAPKK